NAGGIINVGLEYLGQGDRAEVETRIAHIPDRLVEVWDESDRTGAPASDVADSIAKRLIGRNSSNTPLRGDLVQTRSGFAAETRLKRAQRRDPCSRQPYALPSNRAPIDPPPLLGRSGTRAVWRMGRVDPDAAGLSAKGKRPDHVHPCSGRVAG